MLLLLLYLINGTSTSNFRLTFFCFRLKRFGMTYIYFREMHLTVFIQSAWHI
ncbi:hypothetical protein NBRC111894_886 [Sporolactobacillus inulinus]|uniref:Uncharacterized protein n=1 Tax=Sporolactobacillus inulinus TaxID=2078 RepID=A0A4Y1Z8H2_9BACL|nr:hypothetical protein NBRC111894_886 [Sporolactobacillus inulinus]